jgi:hypothetical protein
VSCCARSRSAACAYTHRSRTRCIIVTTAREHRLSVFLPIPMIPVRTHFAAILNWDYPVFPVTKSSCRQRAYDAYNTEESESRGSRPHW